MKQFLQRLKEKVDVGIVGGSDLSKQQEQLGDNSDIDPLPLCVVTNELTYVFSQNGLSSYHNGVKFHETVEYSLNQSCSS